MASDESDRSDSGYVPVLPNHRRKPALAKHNDLSVYLQPDPGVETSEEVEKILSLIDFEFFQGQMSLHNGDKAPRTLDRNFTFIGNGLSFAVWRFSSGRSRIIASYQKGIKGPKEANADPSSSDSFVLKRPLINRHWTNRSVDPVEVTDTMRLKAVLTEIKVLAHPPVLNHPNVVDLLGFLWDTQESSEKSIAPSLVMEDALLGSLDSFQKPDFLTLSIDMKMEIVRDIAKGLDVLHDSGIVHGDLKSA